MKASTRDRLACVDLPAFPLQLLLRRHPEWRGYPTAVVAEDKPQGVILWVNESARRKGVLPGLRGIEHVGLTVPDLDAAVGFFVDVLGCEFVFGDVPFADPDVGSQP